MIKLVVLAGQLSSAINELALAKQEATSAMATEKATAVQLKQDASSSNVSTTTDNTGSSAVKGAQAATSAAQATAAKIAEAKDDSDQVASLTKTLQSQLATAQSKTGSINTKSTQTTPSANTSNVSSDATELLTAQNNVVTAFENLESTVNTIMSILPSLQLSQNESTALSALLTSSDGQNASTVLNDLSEQISQLKGLTTSQAQKQLNDLSAGASQLNSGASEFSKSLPDYTSGVDRAFAGSTTLNKGLSTLNGQVPTLTNGVTQIVNGTAKLAAKGPSLKSGSSQVASGVTTLNSGIQTAAAGVNKLNASTPELTAGGNKLMSSSNKLNQGAGKLNTGIITLSGKVPSLIAGVNKGTNGSQTLDNGSAKLMAGANKLQKGNGTLAKSLKSGADEINAQPLTSKTADMFAVPTNLRHESYSYVPNYGHALAPYVLSVALYVGALVFNFAFPIRKVSMAGGSATGWYLSKVSIGAAEALAMGLIEPALMMLGGLSVDHPGSMFLVSVMFAEASMFIVMFLSMLLDNPGRFIAMVLLMLQLGGSGGTFPMEVTNHFYNVVHPFLPMTYSILGFRQAITSGMSGMVGQAFWMLLLFMVIGLALLWPTMIWSQKKHLMGLSQLDDNQKLQAVEDPESNSHS
ncbi:YhgE/Pip domain-containing protein [Levilactobacillus brevis]|nr:YhgE/Pip domain-containing protein [Levilactobacillus brevis]